MPFPDGILETFWGYYKAEKVAAVDAEGGPANLRPRFLLDFEQKWREWPLLNPEALTEILDVGALGGDDDNGDHLLAVLDMPNDRHEITLTLSRILTYLGPPQWLAVYNDAFSLKVDKLEELPIQHGDLERWYNDLVRNDIHELLTMVAVHSDGSTERRDVHFVYGDDGRVVFADEETESDVMPSVGWMIDLMSNIAVLANFSFEEVMHIIAMGDRMN